MRATTARCHDLHEERHPYAVRDEEPVVRAVRVQVLGRVPRPALPELAPARAPLAAALRSRRPAFFGGFVDTPVYDRYRLAPGVRFEGPAIIEERESTTVIGPRARVAVDGRFTIIAEPAG